MSCASRVCHILRRQTSHALGKTLDRYGRQCAIDPAISALKTANFFPTACLEQTSAIRNVPGGVELA